MYIGKGNAYMREVSRAVQEGYAAGSRRGGKVELPLPLGRKLCQSLPAWAARRIAIGGRAQAGASPGAGPGR